MTDKNTIASPGAGTGVALLQGLACLLLCQSLGEALALLLRKAGLALPGPVLGMLLLAAALTWQRLHAPVATAAGALLAHLSLLFVPVGVGVMTHLPLIAQYGGRMLATLLLSTWIGLAVTALVLRALLPPQPHLETPGPGAGSA